MLELGADPVTHLQCCVCFGARLSSGWRPVPAPRTALLATVIPKVMTRRRWIRTGEVEPHPHQAGTSLHYQDLGGRLPPGSLLMTVHDRQRVAAAAGGQQGVTPKP
jgi:hypothetical protein